MVMRENHGLVDSDCIVYVLSRGKIQDLKKLINKVNSELNRLKGDKILDKTS